MPGYGGSIQHEYNQIAMTFGKAARISHTTAYNYKINPRPPLQAEQTFTANDFYAKLPNPRRKTNSKNRSNVELGDPRAQTFETMNMTSYRARELPNPRAPLVDGFDEMTPEERDQVYRRALEKCGRDGVKKLESDIRLKIDQRTSGGPFALRKAFKYFDRDGSGDIDPDEFFAAMDYFGLQFTEEAVLGLFGLYDGDRGGSLGYYEFVDNIITNRGKNVGEQLVDEYKHNIMNMATPSSPGSPNSPHKLVQSPAAVSKELAKACFDMADKNSSGKIELVELEELFKQFGCSTDSDVLNQAFLMLDKNFDGEVGFEEFWQWWAENTRSRGGAGEQGRARGRKSRAAKVQPEVVGRSGELDMAPTTANNGVGTPPRTNSGAQGGFHNRNVPLLPGRSRRPGSRQGSAGGGDVLANQP
jgi:Ca2+-binding EF-hand superfamily protein